MHGDRLPEAVLHERTMRLFYLPGSPIANVQGLDAEGDVVALQRIDDMAGAEGDAEVLRVQVDLGLAVCHEGDWRGVALRRVAALFSDGSGAGSSTER